MERGNAVGIVQKPLGTVESVRPGSPAYAAVRHVYTATGSPAVVLLPGDTRQVAEALAVARAAGSPFAVRSGGHGISSIATNDGGTVIDLRRLDTVERVGPRLVRLGPGARWGRVARTLHPWGLAISSGDSGDVGVGGLATTGGLGFMGRAHGLTIDRIRAAEIVTADGEVRTVSETEEEELFWAVRGAGANVGIVTAVEIEAAPTPVVGQAGAAYQPGDLAGFLRSWGTAVEAAPGAVSAFLYAGTGFAQATIVYAGDDADAAASAFRPFMELPGLAGQRAALTAYPDVLLTTGAPHMGQQRAITHTGLAVHLDGRLAGRLADLLRGGGADMLQIRSAGGAINDVHPGETAYAHRHQNFSVTAVAAGDQRRFDAAWEPVHELMDGMYLSFETGHRPGHVREAFPPPTLDRLRAIKRKWDPDRVFTQNFDVSELDGGQSGTASSRSLSAPGSTRSSRSPALERSRAYSALVRSCPPRTTSMVKSQVLLVCGASVSGSTRSMSSSREPGAIAERHRRRIVTACSSGQSWMIHFST
jgi:FAD/FMN-containing dehydrogenase